ncbi:MAG: pyruvate kinase [Elusimicrobiota bacterium]|jgi:pyruvate kinase
MHDANHRTKIVATLGPATDNRAVLSELIRLGVDIVRVNASHGTVDEHHRRILSVRRLARGLRKRVEVLIDLPGPKFRLGKFARGSVELSAGQTVRLVPPGVCRQKGCLPLRQPTLLPLIRPKQPVFLADGLVELQVLHVMGRTAVCRVAAGGVVRSGSGLNLPNTDFPVVLPTSQDKEWIRFAARHKAEWLAVSFVQTPEDIRRVRQAAHEWRHRPQIMAKIEKRKALENLEAIVQEADGVMVARGDLGVETPLEEIPFAQKRIIAVSNFYRKKVVTATQMLESMVLQPMPTRAEVTDVANAVIDGTDAVMLSAETAIGRYPVKSVEILSRILSSTEEVLRTGTFLKKGRISNIGDVLR